MLRGTYSEQICTCPGDCYLTISAYTSHKPNDTNVGSANPYLDAGIGGPVCTVCSAPVIIDLVAITIMITLMTWIALNTFINKAREMRRHRYAWIFIWVAILVGLWLWHRILVVSMVFILGFIG